MTSSFAGVCGKKLELLTESLALMAPPTDEELDGPR